MTLFKCSIIFVYGGIIFCIISTSFQPDSSFQLTSYSILLPAFSLKSHRSRKASAKEDCCCCFSIFSSLLNLPAPFGLSHSCHFPPKQDSGHQCIIFFLSRINSNETHLNTLTVGSFYTDRVHKLQQSQSMPSRPPSCHPWPSPSHRTYSHPSPHLLNFRSRPKALNLSDIQSYTSSAPYLSKVCY